MTSTTATSRLGALAMAPVKAVMRVVDIPLRALQKATGTSGMAVFFLAPNMLIFGIFVLLPLAINFVYSTTGGTAFFLSQRQFVGADQYSRLFTCDNFLDPLSCQEDAFWTAVGNTFWFVVLQVTLMILVALITALILNRDLAARSFWRAVFFFPVLLSPVVVGLIWKWILQRQGLLNFGLYQFGMEPYTWLTDRDWTFAATIGVSIWAHMGFYTLILLAGLQAIPKDLYEAAEMDGTKPARVFWRITMPLLFPNLLVVIVLALIRSVQVFDEVYVLTGGGPGTSTLYLTQYIYETGFASGALRNPGLAAAASILMGVVLVVFTLIQLGIARRSENKGKRT